DGAGSVDPAPLVFRFARSERIRPASATCQLLPAQGRGDNAATMAKRVQRKPAKRPAKSSGATVRSKPRKKAAVPKRRSHTANTVAPAASVTKLRGATEKAAQPGLSPRTPQPNLSSVTRAASPTIAPVAAPIT